ncbi:MAG: nucleotidyl transferase AbiEii/AbiGii toxin family protein, partial [Acidimicrobiales bacterium]
MDVPIHSRYGGPLPQLPVVDLAENVAEKISRLNRRSPARDAYDLVWVARTPGLDLDRSLIRRLAVVKAWVD